MRRLEERYAEKDQVGFIGFLRSDGRAINAAALKLLVLA
jgi:HK97 family phage major capsid protein